MAATFEPATLGAFLVTAHRTTYADKSAMKAPSSRHRSFDYHVVRGDLAYHDTYFGARDFIGEEIIYRHDEPIWGMNYFGIVTAPGASEAEIYDFLREALQQDCVGIEPARGPRLFRRGPWTYSNAIEGTLDDFVGTELISRDSAVVYRCRYHGGRIS